MSQRFWTADFHLSMTDILKYENRPFKDIEEHDSSLLNSCFQLSNKDDMIIHLGDLYTFKNDRGSEGGNKKPIDVVNKIPATFLNVRGNHDLNNKVKSLCESLRVHLGKRFLDVSASHYPSYDKHATDHFLQYDIHLCGHVHSSWRHCLDLTNHVLNINVGVDVWNYSIVSEQQLIRYIDSVLKLPSEKVNKIKILDSGKIIKV